MNIRKLEIRDVSSMIEWMNDPRVSKYFTFFGKKFTYDDGVNFINTQNVEKDVHMAIVDENDDYIGTVSLKNIDKKVNSAEYAIALSFGAQGNGHGAEATKNILEYGFNVLGLNRIYLNVLSHNHKAIKLYESFGFSFEGEFKNHIYLDGEVRDLSWYAITKDLFNKRIECKSFEMIEFQELGDERGKLVIVEGMKEIPFDIKRIFYIYGTDGNIVRGQHANRNSEFVLINLSGSSKVLIDTGSEKTIVSLDKPNQAIYINKMIWKEMYDFSDDSVLLVLSNKIYDKNEYIRNYDEYVVEVCKG